jgi:hypothetical protein
MIQSCLCKNVCVSYYHLIGALKLFIMYIQENMQLPLMFIVWHLISCVRHSGIKIQLSSMRMQSIRHLLLRVELCMNDVIIFTALILFLIR